LTLMATVHPRFGEGDINEKVGVWSLLLADINYHLAQQAVVKMLRANKYEPKPADIIEAVQSITDTTPTAEQAWSEVLRQLDPYRTPEWSNKLIQDAVRVMGFRNLCDSESPSIDRAQFIKIYNNLKNRQKNDYENTVVIQLVGGKLKLLG